MPEYRIQFTDDDGVARHYQGRGKGFGLAPATSATYDNYVGAVGTWRQCKRSRCFSAGGEFEGLASRLVLIDNETGEPARPERTKEAHRAVNYQNPLERDLAAVEARNAERIKRDRELMQMNRRRRV